MSGIQQGFPSINTALVDERGFIRQTWLQLLISLWNRTGGGGGTSPGDVAELFAEAGGVQGELDLGLATGMDFPQWSEPEPDQGLLFRDIVIAVLEELGVWAEVGSEVDSGEDGLFTDPAVELSDEQAGLLTPIETSPQTPGLPETLTVGASPYTYDLVVAGTVVVQGGTVTKVEFSRDGGATLVDCGAIAGMFPALAADQIVVTYTVAPTMTFIPMGV